MTSGEALAVLEYFPSSVGWIHRCRTWLWRDDRISVSQKRKQNLDRLRTMLTGNLTLQLRHQSLFILPPWHETHKFLLSRPEPKAEEPCSKLSNIRKTSVSQCNLLLIKGNLSMKKKGHLEHPHVARRGALAFDPSSRGTKVGGVLWVQDQPALHIEFQDYIVILVSNKQTNKHQGQQNRHMYCVLTSHEFNDSTCPSSLKPHNSSVSHIVSIIIPLYRLENRGFSLLRESLTRL